MRSRLVVANMDNSTTLNSNVLRKCDETEGECDDMNWEILCTTLNAFSIVINILHLTVLNKMPSLKGKTYLKLLNHIGIVDIVSSISVVLQTNCQLHLLTHEKTKVIAASMSITTNWAPTVRYCLFALGSYDRYLAICQPLLYEQSKVVRYFDWYVLASWGLCLAILSVRDSVFITDLCLHEMLGASNYLAVAPLAYTCTMLVVFCSISAGLQSRICIEVYRIHKRHQVANNNQVIKAALYILIIYIEFVICLCPVLVCFLLTFEDKCDSLMAWSIALLFALYGTVNSLTYGWLNQPYRIQAMKMMGCKRSNKVVAFTATTKTDQYALSSQVR